MKKLLALLRSIVGRGSTSVTATMPISVEYYAQLVAWKGDLDRDRSRVLESAQDARALVIARAEIERLTNIIHARGDDSRPALSVTAPLNERNEWIGNCPSCSALLRMQVADADGV